jgi:hypothetical protein
MWIYRTGDRHNSPFGDWATPARFWLSGNSSECSVFARIFLSLNFCIVYGTTNMSLL